MEANQDEASQRCIACNRAISDASKPCECGHVNEAMRTIAGKRFSGYREELYTRLVIKESRAEYKRMQRRTKIGCKRPAKTEEVPPVRARKRKALVLDGTHLPSTATSDELMNSSRNGHYEEISGHLVREGRPIETSALSVSNNRDRTNDSTSESVTRNSSCFSSKSSKGREVVKNRGDGMRNCRDRSGLNHHKSTSSTDNTGFQNGSIGVNYISNHDSPNINYNQNSNYHKIKPIINRENGRSLDGSVDGINDFTISRKYHNDNSETKPSRSPKNNTIHSSVDGTSCSSIYENNSVPVLLPAKHIPTSGPLAEINKRLLNQRVFWMCLADGFSFGKAD